MQYNKLVSENKNKNYGYQKESKTINDTTKEKLIPINRLKLTL